MTFHKVSKKTNVSYVKLDETHYDTFNQYIGLVISMIDVALLTNMEIRPVIDIIITMRSRRDKYGNDALLTLLEHDEENNSMTFNIELLHGRMDRVALSLAHELVHVIQYANGMKDIDDNTVEFKGKLYNNTDDDIFYWLYSPWEIEARGIEQGLYKLAIESNMLTLDYPMEQYVTKKTLTSQV